MVTVNSASDTIWMLVVAAALGAVGAFVGELIATRGARRDTGAIERPHSLGPKYVDLGTWASFPVGLINGAVAVWLFSPIQQSSAGVREYAVERLAGIALLAGVAGPAFLRTSARRLLAEMNEERMRAALTTAKAVADALPAGSRNVTADQQSADGAHADAVRVALDAALSVNAAR